MMQRRANWVGAATTHSPLVLKRVSPYNQKVHTRDPPTVRG